MKSKREMAETVAAAKLLLAKSHYAGRHPSRKVPSCTICALPEHERQQVEDRARELAAEQNRLFVGQHQHKDGPVHNHPDVNEQHWHAEEVKEMTETTTDAPKRSRRGKKGEADGQTQLTEAQAKKAQAAKRTEAAKAELEELRRVAKQIEEADVLRDRRNELITKLLADGVETKAVQENSGLTMPRFRQITAKAKA